MLKNVLLYSIVQFSVSSLLMYKVNKKFERKYRDCIKRKGDKIGTQTCYDIST